MFDIIRKDTNSINLYFLETTLLKQKEKKGTLVWPLGFFSRTALKIVPGP